VVTRLADAGHWSDGDPDILAVFDSGYDLTRLAWCGQCGAEIRPVS
jgi:hypothetical protein